MAGLVIVHGHALIRAFQLGFSATSWEGENPDDSFCSNNLRATDETVADTLRLHPKYLSTLHKHINV